MHWLQKICLIHREFWVKSFCDEAIFWAMVTAVATVALILVGYFQLRELVRTRKADFAKKLSDDFFTPDVLRLLNLLSLRRLRFIKQGPQIYFQILPPEIPEAPLPEELRETEERVGVQAIVQYILNPLELIAYWERIHVITLEDASFLFGRAILLCGDNPEVMSLVQQERAAHRNPSLYVEFERLYGRLKRRKPPIA